MADKKASPDEESKKKIAKRVVTNKALYFVPDHGTVEAEDLDDAVKQSKKLTESEEEGDG